MTVSAPTPGGGSLAPGASLGRYRVTGLLGAGGMGEVYEAEDTRLHRAVAVKVLPALANDPARLKRFEREARAVAALNHPNIVTVHSVEEEDGRVFIVMERVRGRTLAKLIPPGGFSTPELLRLAVPLADAVGAAHRQGITHRDLKPHNIMVGDDGRLKVLDFGLAKGTTTGAIPEETTATADGAVLGTVAYMSPEQAQGEPVDPRSDIFSLGIVLFEMATGRRPFSGANNLSIITAILRDPAPSVRELNGGSAPGIERVVRRCLEKDPSRRYQSAVDLMLDLEEVRDRPEAAHPQPRPAGRWRRLVAPVGVGTLGTGRWRRLVAPIAVGALAIAAVTLTVSRLGGAPPPESGPRVTRLVRLTTDEGPELSPSLAPDGTWFVYSRRGPGSIDVFRQRVGGENPMNLTPDSEHDDEDPAISPDGEQIAFRTSSDGIFVMGATGESVRRVTKFGRHPVWSPDGRQIAFSSEKVQLDTSLYRGTSEVFVVTLETGEVHKAAEATAAQPAFSPRGLRLAFFRVDPRGQRDLWTARPDGTDPTRLMDDPAIDWNPVWSPDGRWLYFASDRGGVTNLWRLPIDEASGHARGPAEPVTTSSGSRDHSLSFSRDGSRMLFTADTTRYLIRRVPFDETRGEATGPAEPVVMGGSPSVHGDRVAYETIGRDDIAVANVDGLGRVRLTDDVHKDFAPQWSPDGTRIAFRSDRDGKFQCWSIRPDGSELVRLSAFAGGIEGRRCLWSPDGARMAVRVEGGKLAIFEPNRPWAEQTPQMVAARVAFTPYSWSPDGQSIAGFAIPETGNHGTLLFDVATSTWRETPVVISLPVWLSDSRRVLFQLAGQIEVVELASGQHHRVVADRHQGLGNFTLSGDGRWLYHELIALETDVWIATLETPADGRP